MAFWETEFPRAISFGSAGGDRFFTTVNRGFSGAVQTKKNWTLSAAYFTIELHGKPQSYFDLVHKFFLNVGGKADGFRLYWPIDNSFQNQIIGTGDGSNKTFQLIKTYATAARQYTRTITKPITSLITDFQGNTLTDTVNVYLNGTLKTHSAGYHGAGDYTLDETTGIITFVAAPGNGVIVTADAQFHIPVHFDVDDMNNAQVIPSDVSAGTGIINWSQLNMEELR